MVTTSTLLKPEVVRQAKIYKRALRSANIPVTHLIVFGSQTKGTARPDSDIDVAVVSPSFGKDYHKELVRLLDVRSDEILEIEPHPLHPNDLNDRWSTLVAEIKKYGVKV